MVKESSAKNKLSLKNFLVFSWAMYPIWLLWYLVYDKTVALVQYKSLVPIVAFIFFSLINWLFCQRKLKKIIIIIPNLILFYSIFRLFFPHAYFDWSNIVSSTFMSFMAIMSVLIIYFVGFCVIVFAQFITWVPFLVKYTYENRKRLDRLKFE